MTPIYGDWRGLVLGLQWGLFPLQLSDGSVSRGHSLGPQSAERRALINTWLETNTLSENLIEQRR